MCYYFFCILNFYLFLTVLGLGCCAGFSLVVAHRLLIVVASLAADHGLSSCGSQALEHRLNSSGTWA